MTPQTPFVIGSITKPFTALGITQLVEAGKIELDAPVQRYLPWFRVADPSASKLITVRELLYQTSGISQASTLETWDWDNDDAAIERHVRLLAHAALLGPPGKTFAYANANYTTLGVIIQAVSGESYEDYVRAHIFAPLDMRHSYLSQEEAEHHGLATGHRWLFGFPVVVTLPSSRANLLTAVLHFVWPLALVVVALTASYWVLIVMFQPDLVYWAAAVAVGLFLKGVLEIAMACRAFGPAAGGRA